MSDGVCCHNCRKYSCVCLSSDAMKLLRVALLFAKNYRYANPEVGLDLYPGMDLVERELEKEGIEVCKNDIMMAFKSVRHRE